MPIDVSSAKAKLKWAKKHIQKLNALIESYRAAEPYTMVVHQKAEGIFGVIVVLNDPPEDIPFVIGDAVHNMWSALDHAICGIVRSVNGNAKGVQFPFAKNAECLERTVKERHIARAGEKVVAEIESLRPYRGGDPAIIGLHDLDVEDKHRRIITVSKYAGTPSQRVTDEAGNEVFSAPFNPLTGLENGKEVFLGPRLGNLKLGQNIKIAFEIMFGDGTFEGRPVIGTLCDLVPIVDGMIDRLALAAI